jgi:hypothetical protein
VNPFGKGIPGAKPTTQDHRRQHLNARHASDWRRTDRRKIQHPKVRVFYLKLMVIN